VRFFQLFSEISFLSREDFPMRPSSRFMTAGVAMAGLALTSVATASPASAADPRGSSETFYGDGNSIEQARDKARAEMNAAIEAGT
jgi:hypothetical protein